MDFELKKRFFVGYKRLFEHARRDQKAGEVCNSYLLYLLDGNIASFMRTVLPEVKLFVVLRNPVDRYLSHFFFQRSLDKSLIDMGFDPVLDGYDLDQLATDVTMLETWWANPGAKDIFNPIQVRWLCMGFYPQALFQLVKYYKPHQIHVVLFDDIKTQPERVLMRMCMFLGIDESFKFTNTAKAINVTRQKQEVPQELRGRLLDIYRPSILKLGEMLRRDLSAWLE